MGWIKKEPYPPAKHHCYTPSPLGAGPGSIWSCDDCGQLWKTYKSWIHGVYWMKEKK